MRDGTLPIGTLIAIFVLLVVLAVGLVIADRWRNRGG